MPDSTTMGIERIEKIVTPRSENEGSEFRAPTEDPVLAGLLREAQTLSNSTFVVPLRIDRSDLGGAVNEIRRGVFANGVVVPLAGPETGHAVQQVGPGEVFANADLVVDGGVGEGVGMSIAQMHRIEAAARVFVPLAQDEYRLVAARKVLENTGQTSVYDPKMQTHLNFGQIEGRLADLKESYQTHFDEFWEKVTGEKVARPEIKRAKKARVGNLMAPPIRVVDEAPKNVAQVPSDVLDWFKNIEVDWGKVGLVALGGLSLLAPACAAATPVAPTPINFPTPEASPTAVTPPTAEPTATTAPTEAPTKVPPTKTPEATARPTEVSASGVAESLGLPEGNYSFSEFNQGGLKKTYLSNEKGGVVAVLGKEGWESLAETEKRLAELRDEQGSYLWEKHYKDGALIVYAEHSGEFSVKDVPIGEGKTAKVSHLVYILTEKGLVPILAPTVIVLEDGRFLGPSVQGKVFDAPYPQNEHNTWVPYLQNCCDSQGRFKDGIGFVKGKLLMIGVASDWSKADKRTIPTDEASKIRQEMALDYYGGFGDIEKFRKGGVWDFELLVNVGISIVP